MDLGLRERCLQSVLIEYTVRMQLSDVYFIVIESPFRVEREGESISLSPEDDPDEAFAPVRELVGQKVIEAISDNAGGLRVTFENGAHLVVDSDPAYEAWSVSGPDGALVVSTPGGKLAVWSAKPSDNEQ